MSGAGGVDAADPDDTDDAPATDDTADPLFPLVAGLYVLAVMVPAVPVTATALAPGDDLVLAAVITGALGLAALAAVAAVGPRARRTLPGAHPAAWLLVVVPVGWLLAAYVRAVVDARPAEPGPGGVVGALVDAAAPLVPPSLPVWSAILASAAGALVGVALVGMAKTRYANAELAETRTLGRFAGRWPRRIRRATSALFVVTVAAALGGFVAEFGFGVADAHLLYLLLFVAAPLAGQSANERAFLVTDAGLVVERPLQRRFRPWSTYAGYRLTDDAIVLVSHAPWRPAHRVDRTDVADVDAAVAALDQVLERR